MEEDLTLEAIKAKLQKIRRLNPNYKTEKEKQEEKQELRRQAHFSNLFTMDKKPNYHIRFTFGRYINTPIGLVPDQYLDFIIQNFGTDSKWRVYCIEERRRRIRTHNTHITELKNSIRS